MTMQHDRAQHLAAHDLHQLVEVLGVVSGKWIPTILVALSEGPKRNFQLRVVARGISAKALSDSLRRLVRDGLVTHTLHDDGRRTVGVGYALTPLGQETVHLLADVQRWASENFPAISVCREQAEQHIVSP